MIPATAVLFVAVPPNVKFSAEEKRALKSFANTLAKRVAGGRRGFTCAITNDEALRNLNKTFRDCDYATDVLSFPLSRDGSDWGDIAISAERAAEQAAEFGHSKLDEVRLLMLHGVLHLTGMDHEHDRGEMARAESEWRAEFGLEKGLIERSSGVEER